MATDGDMSGERAVICRDDPAGLLGVIVVDDTRVGPALGGIRMRPYPTLEAARAECARLARQMTLKCALAEIGFGGGKSVIVAPAAGVDRDVLLRAFGRFVAELDGAYIPAADMGTTSADLAIVAETAGDAATVDTSEATARGVFAAIRAAVRVAGRRPDLDGVTVYVQGVGNVGARLARALAAAGARLLLADADAARVESLARELGATTVAPERGIDVDCDVYAPCAIARTIDPTTVDGLRARIVAGAANDVLDHPRLAATLAERGIAYVPDFVAGAGGVIQVRAARDGWSDEQLQTALAAIGTRVESILAEAAERSTDTDGVARRRAEELLAKVGTDEVRGADRP